MASDETLTPQQKYGLFVACALPPSQRRRAAFAGEATAKVDALSFKPQVGCVDHAGMNNAPLPLRTSRYQ